jgi:hypothetical protein
MRPREEAATMAKDDAETLRRKREKLEAELAVLRDQERTAAEKCYAIAGRAALDHAAKNPGFKRELMRALDAELVRGRERKLFGLSGPGRAGTAEAGATVAAATEGRESAP